MWPFLIDVFYFLPFSVFACTVEVMCLWSLILSHAFSHVFHCTSCNKKQKHLWLRTNFPCEITFFLNVI
uniref:Uncharacterized protein n=1 Tax=Anguilla anguilla TaxID=7936 RepID=A0A0E9Q4F6_ANGAN